MSKALAFIAGMGTGYFNAEAKKKEEARQAERDKQRTELHDMQMRKLGREEADVDAVRAAGAAPEVTPLAGPKSAAQIAAEGAAFDPTAAAPVQGGELGFQVGSRLPGARVFAERGVAENFARTQDTPEAATGRMQALARQGNAGATSVLRDQAQLRAANLQADGTEMDLAEKREIAARKALSRGAAQAIGTGGWAGFANFATKSYNDDNFYEAIEDGKGGATIVSRDKDGKEIGRKTFASTDDAIMFTATQADPTKWVEYQAGKADKAQDQKNKDRAFDLQRDAQASTERYRDAQLRMDGARLSMARAAHDAENRLPPAVKAQYATFDKELTLLATTIAKAQADGTWDPKSSGAQSLMEQQRVAMAKSSALLAPYLPKAGGGAGDGDRFGIFADGPATPSGGGVTPAPRAGAGGRNSAAYAARQGIGTPETIEGYAEALRPAILYPKP